MTYRDTFPAKHDDEQLPTAPVPDYAPAPSRPEPDPDPLLTPFEPMPMPAPFPGSGLNDDPIIELPIPGGDQSV